MSWLAALIVLGVIAHWSPPVSAALCACDSIIAPTNCSYDPQYPVMNWQDGDDDGYGLNGSEQCCECDNSAYVGFASTGGDCDDSDPARNPGNSPESSCSDGIDNDCDGSADMADGDCVCDDVDGDGFDDDACGGNDCDDGNADAFPGAAPNDGAGCMEDADGDDWGDASPPAGVTAGTDCDDGNGSISPGASESCNGVDDDCDTMVDEGVQNPYYRDADSDSYGDSGDTTMACSPPAGYVADNTDCDDATATTYPGATETCNMVDDDCDTMIDEGVQNTYYRDADSDTYGNASDTTMACAAPGGYVADSTDCDDGDATVNPGEAEVCNGIDDNCDTNVDEGCEVCDGVDDDMDGQVDEEPTDCPAGTACNWGTCHSSCMTSGDCGAGDACYTDDMNCYDDTDPCNDTTCPAPMVCYQGGCYDPCMDDADCTPPMVCFDGRCAESACDDVQCVVGEICKSGSCYDPCMTTTDCMGADVCLTAAMCSDTCDEYCEEPTGPCDGVQCAEGPPAEVCHQGSCYDACASDADCTPPQVCFDGRCTEDPCSDVYCPEGQMCYWGSCVSPCSTSGDCSGMDACLDAEICSSMCSEWCGDPDDPCNDITCPDGQLCHMGSCYDPCANDSDCTPPNTCFDGRCTDDACADVFCPEGETCRYGECYPECSYAAMCDPANELCYQGACVPEDCDGIVCPDGQTCYQGECYDPCMDDDDCTPPNTCFDGRCAPDACDAQIDPSLYPYHTGHIFTRTGRWLKAKQSSTPTTYPRPGETADFTTLADFDGTSSNTSGLHQTSKARLALFLDTSETDSDNPEGKYVLWLTQGRATAGQQRASAVYSIRWASGIDGGDLDVVLDDDDESVRRIGGNPDQHQIVVTSGAGETGGVALGHLPASENWTIRIDASFDGDVDGWELYDAETGGVMPLDGRESLLLQNLEPSSPDALVAPEFGRGCAPDPSDPLAKGMCSSGSYTSCRIGWMWCERSITPWDKEVCDGVDNTCTGTIDDPSEMEVPMVWVRQPDGGNLSSWTRWPSDDRMESVRTTLNYTPIGSDDRAGAPDYLDRDGNPIQHEDRSVITVHRDLRDGTLSIPFIWGRNVSGSVAFSRDIDVDLEFDTDSGYYSDQLFASWYDDRTNDGWIDRDRVLEDLDDDKIETEHELSFTPSSTEADADAVVWQPALEQHNTGDELVFLAKQSADDDLEGWHMIAADGTRTALEGDDGDEDEGGDGDEIKFRVRSVPLDSAVCYAGGMSGCAYGHYECVSGSITCTGDAGACACSDVDGDGFAGYDPFTCPSGEDCDDSNASIHPGATEVCNAVDDDCDGAIDMTLVVDGGECPSSISQGFCGPPECDYRVSCICSSPGNCECGSG